MEDSETALENAISEGVVFITLSTYYAYLGLPSQAPSNGTVFYRLPWPAQLGGSLHFASKLLHLSMSTLGNSTLWQKGRVLAWREYIHTHTHMRIVQHSLRQRRLGAEIDERRRRGAAVRCSALLCHATTQLDLTL